MPAKRTAMPTAAGILSIIAGALGLLAGIGLFVGGLFTVGLRGIIIGAFYPPLIIALAVVAIVGGAYTLRRKAWGLALAAAICSVFCVWFLGIPAVILVALARNEF
ncbi:MAG: hypothetical protein SV910_08550 [Chloroflexota bacterium]|nr:hypothetical protein [Chloroflexota bacterium]